MKIGLVCPYDFAYPSGVANHVISLEHQFTKMGHEVKVIAPASRSVSACGGRFIQVGKPLPIPASGSMVRITLSMNLKSRVEEILEQENFDIIHLHEPLMPMLCLTTLLSSHAPTVGTFHACYRKPKYAPGKPLDGYNLGKPLSTVFLRRWARKLDGRIAVSEPARQHAGKHFPGEYEIIPNGVDVQHFSPETSPIPKFGDEKLNILFVGRLEKRKGFDYLLEAYKKVKREIPNSRLIVVGPGTMLRRKYENQIMAEGIKDVVFAGYASYDELPRFYKTADIFCAPATSWESFGIVLLEAMATGKPVVASNIEGYAGVVTNSVDGLLVPPKDSESLAQALLYLMKDETLRREMGARGRLKAQDYSWEHIARRILDFYNEALNKHVESNGFQNLKLRHILFEAKGKRQFE
ncbi:MAG: glycosyltransferase family 4 protein [Chloroflexi bacterium]|nr:glycosyltransferase family 4 protein [Chloroflexota bacterium]